MNENEEEPLWEGRCHACAVHYLETPHLLGAFASVGIEFGKSSYEMAIDYFAAFHKRGHRDG